MDELIYGSVCSGIEAATVKTCAKCRIRKPLSEFHKQPSTKDGRHCYCTECFNGMYRGVRRRKTEPAARRLQNLRARYGLEAEEISEMLGRQSQACGICANPLQRFHVDHDHTTGAVRGLLCHRCNLLIGGWDDRVFRVRALAYLGIEVKQ